MSLHTWPRMASVALLCLSVGASERQGSLMAAGPPPPAEELRFRLGTVALAQDPNPAKFSFQKAEGQIDYPGERAGAAAGGLLGTRTSDPLVNTVLGAATFVMAPVAAVNGAVGARKRLSPGKLSDCEADLSKAMGEMAVQKRFQNWLMKAAGEKCPGRLVPIEQSDIKALDGSRFDAVLEARIEELRLERTGKGDTSYALRIKTHTRLLRTADGGVLYDQPAEYRSGRCLFLDWTLLNAFQSVAETGYRQLAEQIIEQSLSTTDRPLLAGVGFDRERRLQRVGTAPVRANSSKRSPASRSSEVIDRTGDEFPWQHPPLQRISYSPTDTNDIEPFGISFSANATHVTVQKPLTRQEATSEAIRDTEFALDGLDSHPNPVVMLGATVVAVPISLWKQGAAMVSGLSPNQIGKAAAELDKVASRMRPAQELAFEVAQRLADDQSRAVVLAKQPLTDSTPPNHGSGILLEIQVESAALRGKDGSNRKLALCIEAKATLRSADGEQLYSCPVQYRSKERKFTEWAVHDAQPFRNELKECYQALGTAIVDQLVARGIVPQDRKPQTTFAKR